MPTLSNRFAMDEARLQTTHKSFEPQFRCESFTKDEKLTVELSDGKYIQVEVPIKNTGPLPAGNFILYRFDAVIGQKGNARKPQYHEFLATPHAIPPATQGVNSDLVVPGTEDISQRVNQLKKGDIWLEFSVLVTYDDEFGQTHHSEFCDLFTIGGPTDICPWPVQND